MKALYLSDKLIIREMSELDISPICRAEHEETTELSDYLWDQIVAQKKGESIAILAVYQGNIAGYVFLYKKCKWGGLGGMGLPGIVDLFVLEPYRKKGIASRLMDTAEHLAADYHSMVYLDIDLHLQKRYSVAQQLYSKRGYLPTGAGKHSGCHFTELLEETDEDQVCTICMVKKLK